MAAYRDDRLQHIDAALQSLRACVRDPDNALDAIARHATDPAQCGEVLALLQKILGEAAARPPKFTGHPRLAILGLPWIAMRAHGVFDDDQGHDTPLNHPLAKDPISTRHGHEQGAWLAMTYDRANLAVLTEWLNPMDLVDLQEIPAGSVVLHGQAAPQQGCLRTAARTVHEALPGGAWQVAHLGQCPPGGPVSAQAAHRRTVDGWAMRHGKRLLPV